jgi:MscS family membrane protein
MPWAGFCPAVSKLTSTTYLLDAAVKEWPQDQQRSSWYLARFGANAGIMLILVVAFAETHSLNIFGLVASLGIGGIAM